MNLPDTENEHSPKLDLSMLHFSDAYRKRRNLQFDVGTAAEAGTTFRSAKDSANVIAVTQFLIWI